MFCVLCCHVLGFGFGLRFGLDLFSGGRWVVGTWSLCVCVMLDLRLRLAGESGTGSGTAPLTRSGAGFGIGIGIGVKPSLCHFIILSCMTFMSLFSLLSCLSGT